MPSLVIILIFITYVSILKSWTCLFCVQHLYLCQNNIYSTLYNFCFDLGRTLQKLDDEVSTCEAQMLHWKTNLAIMVSKERQYIQQHSNYKVLPCLYTSSLMTFTWEWNIVQKILLGSLISHNQNSLKIYRLKKYISRWGVQKWVACPNRFISLEHGSKSWSWIGLFSGRKYGTLC